MGANNAERIAPEVGNVFQINQGAEGFAMRRSRLRQTRAGIDQQVSERWATYRAPQDDMPALARQPVDDSQAANAASFAFMAQHIASVESNLYRTTVWLRVPTAAGNPFGIGQEFSGRTLAQAVDAAIDFINLTRK